MVPIIIFLFVVILLNNFFIVRKIICTLNNAPCTTEITKVLNILLDSNSLLINKKDQLASIKTIYPVEKIDIIYKPFNTLKISLEGNTQNIQVNAYLVSNLPVLSMDLAPSSTDSAGWWVKPTGELEDYIKTQNSQGFDLWEDGTMTSTATQEAVISYIFSEKPTPEKITSIYKVITLVKKYLDVSRIYIVNSRCFLSRPGQPDIIVGVPFDEASLSQALQSINYLATIKKDTKVIDFSFKNPIIR